MTKQEQLDSIIQYLEYANLVFVEPFSLISSTVVEASYITGIPKNTILIHINKTFKAKYGEKFIKAQIVARKIANGENPDVDNIDDEPKKGKGRGLRSEFGKKYREYTGLTSKENRELYVSCRTYFEYHKDYPWNNKDKWQKICERYKFVDSNIEEKVEK